MAAVYGLQGQLHCWLACVELMNIKYQMQLHHQAHSHGSCSCSGGSRFGGLLGSTVDAEPVSFWHALQGRVAARQVAGIVAAVTQQQDVTLVCTQGAGSKATTASELRFHRLKGNN
jgi:hypothetical protein